MSEVATNSLVGYTRTVARNSSIGGLDMRI